VSETLTDWLRLMLEEVARKRLESERAAAERRVRDEEAGRRGIAPGARPDGDGNAAGS
jgi:hypothetical protein